MRTILFLAPLWITLWGLKKNYSHYFTVSFKKEKRIRDINWKIKTKSKLLSRNFSFGDEIRIVSFFHTVWIHEKMVNFENVGSISSAEGSNYFLRDKTSHNFQNWCHHKLCMDSSNFSHISHFISSFSDHNYLRKNLFCTWSRKTLTEIETFCHLLENESLYFTLYGLLTLL